MNITFVAGIFIVATLMMLVLYVPVESFAKRGDDDQTRKNHQPLEVKDVAFLCSDDPNNSEKKLCVFEATFTNTGNNPITLLDAKIPTIKDKRENRSGTGPLTFEFDKGEIAPGQVLSPIVVVTLDTSKDLKNRGVIIFHYDEEINDNVCVTRPLVSPLGKIPDPKQ